MGRTASRSGPVLVEVRGSDRHENVPEPTFDRRVMGLPGVERGTSPGANCCRVLHGIERSRDLSHGDRAQRLWRREPMKAGLMLSQLQHHGVGARGRNSVLELQLEPRKVQPDRLHRRAGARLSGMLHGVGIHRQPVNVEQVRVGIFTSQHRAECRPTACGRQHIGMGRTILRRKFCATARAALEIHSQPA